MWKIKKTEHISVKIGPTFLKTSDFFLSYFIGRKPYLATVHLNAVFSVRICCHPAYRNEALVPAEFNMKIFAGYS